MRFEDLKVFIVLSEVANFHRAANKTGLTQSAVTKIVQRLEVEFGTPLLRRDGRGVELTNAGRVLAARAAAVRSSVLDTYAEMASAKSASTSKIRIGTAHALESILIPIIARFVEQDDEARFSLTIQISSILPDEIMEGSLDMALCFLFDELPPELQSDNFGRQRYSIVARKGHPLESLNGDLEALGKARWLLPFGGNGMRAMIERYFKDSGLGAPNIVVETDVSTSQLSSLVRESNLVTIVTNRMLQGAAGLDLVTLPYADAYSESGLRLVYRRNAHHPLLMQKIRSLIKAALLDS